MRSWKIAGSMTALLASLLVSASQAGVTLNGVRIGARDVAALARFYQTAFGMFEVQRIQTPQMLEVMLDFGATADAAKANNGADVVIMQRAADDGADTMAHVVFNVTDIDAVVKAVKAAGGKMERDPFEFGNTGIRIGMGIDPAGNHFEMIQAPKR
jgi:predicted enzyme related to lactoylglutathione lyase